MLKKEMANDVMAASCSTFSQKKTQTSFVVSYVTGNGQPGAFIVTESQCREDGGEPNYKAMTDGVGKQVQLHGTHCRLTFVKLLTPQPSSDDSRLSIVT